MSACIKPTATGPTCPVQVVPTPKAPATASSSGITSFISALAPGGSSDSARRTQNDASLTPGR
ncbi:hypothetical protein FRB90_002702, partial [Tulasnella sp. 427]